MRGTPGAPVWQRGYYEHVARDEAELHQIRAYIVKNPLRWALDSENPAVARPSRTGRRTDAIQTMFETGAA